MEERVIKLRNDRVISLTKSEQKEKISYVMVGLKWGKIQVGGRMEKLTNTTIKVYDGNWFQKLFHFGPYHLENKEVMSSVGLGSPRYEAVDLDASICIYNSQKRPIDLLYYGHLQTGGGSLWHSSDDLTGSNDAESEKGDNETMTIDFTKLPEDYCYMVVILNSYRHHKFDKIPYAQMNIYETDKGRSGAKSKLFAEYRLDNNPEFKGKEALVLGAFYKKNGNWEFKACGESTTETSITSIRDGSAKRFIKNL